MKKTKGFTLAEVLMTLGIVGVIAAITLPLINNFSPDAKKVKYLKTYDMLVSSMNDIANNNSYYPLTDYNPNSTTQEYITNYAGYPLFNTSSVKLSDGTNIAGGKNKIARVFQHYSGLNCSGCESINEKPASFTTKNNVKIAIKTYEPKMEKKYNKWSCEYKTDITATIEDTVFKFVLTADGKIHVAPDDELGNKYLKTRNSWKKLDYSNVNVETDNNIYTSTNFSLARTEIEDLKIKVTPDSPEKGVTGGGGGNGGGNGGGGNGGGDNLITGSDLGNGVFCGTRYCSTYEPYCCMGTCMTEDKARRHCFAQFDGHEELENRL